jgi:hypothetical protein
MFVSCVLFVICGRATRAVCSLGGFSVRGLRGLLLFRWFQASHRDAEPHAAADAQGGDRLLQALHLHKHGQGAEPAGEGLRSEDCGGLLRVQVRCCLVLPACLPVCPSVYLFLCGALFWHFSFSISMDHGSPLLFISRCRCAVARRFACSRVQLFVCATDRKFLVEIEGQQH